MFLSTPPTFPASPSWQSKSLEEGKTVLSSFKTPNLSRTSRLDCGMIGCRRQEHSLTLSTAVASTICRWLCWEGSFTSCHGLWRSMNWFVYIHNNYYAIAWRLELAWWIAYFVQTVHDLFDPCIKLILIIIFTNYFCEKKSNKWYVGTCKWQKYT